MQGPLRITALVGSLIVACGPSRATTQGAQSPAASTQAQAPQEPMHAAPRRAAGVAHSGTIDQVAIAPSGDAALTRDTIGGVRLWPALDGSLEPQPVPVTSPRSMALLRDGERFVAFVVESSGGARMVSVDPHGNTKDVHSMPPFEPVQQIVALRSGAAPRFVALMKDGALRVFDTDGTQLLTYDDKDFQPTSLRASADGRHLVSVSPMAVGTGAKAEVQRFSFGERSGKLTLERSGVPHIVTANTDLAETVLVVAPDGAEVAVLARQDAGKWTIELHQLEADVKPRTLEVDAPMHVQTHLGYTGPQTLLLSSNDGTPSRLVDTKSGNVRLRAGIPQDFNHQGAAQASAAGRQIVGYGTFLFVNEVEHRQHRFLGYQALNGSSVGLSPSGTHVAWAFSNGPVLVESVTGDAAPVELDTSSSFGGTRVRFLDDDHVVMVDDMGGVSLVEWRTGDVVATAGTMSNVRSVQIDTEQGILVLERHANEAWVYEVDVASGFAGPYIVGNVFRVNILRPAAPSDVVLWTLQPSNESTTFTLDQLRADLTVAEVEALSTKLTEGEAPPMAVDPRGRAYGIRWNGTGLEMVARHGRDTVAARPIPSNDINALSPSPAGDRLLATVNRSGVISAVMHEADTLEPVWSHSTGVFQADTVWSEDGRFVALASTTGSVLLDAKTGEPVMERCGLRFTALAAPPQSAFAAPNQKSLCEQ